MPRVRDPYQHHVQLLAHEGRIFAAFAEDWRGRYALREIDESVLGRYWAEIPEDQIEVVLTIPSWFRHSRSLATYIASRDGESLEPVRTGRRPQTINRFSATMELTDSWPSMNIASRDLGLRRATLWRYCHGGIPWGGSFLLAWATCPSN